MKLRLLIPRSSSSGMPYFSISSDTSSTCIGILGLASFLGRPGAAMMRAASFRAKLTCPELKTSPGHRGSAVTFYNLARFWTNHAVEPHLLVGAMGNVMPVALISYWYFSPNENKSRMYQPFRSHRGVTPLRWNLSGCFRIKLCTYHNRKLLNQSCAPQFFLFTNYSSNSRFPPFGG